MNGVGWESEQRIVPQQLELFASLSETKPGVFDFLGFTHYCGHSRAGKFKLKRKTAKKKLRQKLQAMKDWLRLNLTTPIDEVWQTLGRKLAGHYQYYGVNDNWVYLLSYRDKVIPLVSRWVGPGTISHSSDIARFVQGGVVRTFCCAALALFFREPVSADRVTITIEYSQFCPSWHTHDPPDIQE